MFTPNESINEMVKRKLQVKEENRIVKFAQLDGRIVHIDEVINGKKCNCICCYCNEKVIAKNNGHVKEHHFAHSSGINCGHAYESSIHQLAKQILEKEKMFAIPSLEIDLGNYPFKPVNQKVIRLENVVIENKIFDFRPDIIAEVKGQKLCIEIHFRHAVEELKIEKIHLAGISTIEVDLSKLDNDITEARLRDILCFNFDNKKWMYHAKYETKKMFLKSISNTKNLYRWGYGYPAHVDNCPKQLRISNGMFYADFETDCMICDFWYGGGLLTGSNQYSPMLCGNLDNPFKGLWPEQKYWPLDKKKSLAKTLDEIWQQEGESHFRALDISSDNIVFISVSPTNQRSQNFYGNIFGIVSPNDKSEWYGLKGSQEKIRLWNSKQWLFIDHGIMKTFL